MFNYLHCFNRTIYGSIVWQNIQVLFITLLQWSNVLIIEEMIDGASFDEVLNSLY